MSRRMTFALFLVLLTAIALCSCATTRASAFDRHVAARQWTEAAALFAADSGLHASADALFQAAMLHGTAGRPTYDPQRAVDLLDAFVGHFPSDRRRVAATERAALLREVVALRLELQRLKEIDLQRPQS